MDFISGFLASNFFRNFIMFPLVAVGIYQTIRGLVMVIEKDASEKEWLVGWRLIAYIAITFAGAFFLNVLL